jgi:hypothetical protein
MRGSWSNALQQARETFRKHEEVLKTIRALALGIHADTLYHLTTTSSHRNKAL